MSNIRPVNTHNKKQNDNKVVEEKKVVTQRAKQANPVYINSNNKKSKSSSISMLVITTILTCSSILGLVTMYTNVFVEPNVMMTARGLTRVFNNTSVESIITNVESPVDETTGAIASGVQPGAQPGAQPANPNLPGISQNISYGAGAGTGDGKMVKVAKGWLTLYDDCTVAGNYYSVDVTSINGYIANKWSMGEGRDYSGNKFAKQSYSDQSISRPNGASDGYVDSQNRYWVAVGPCVTNKNFNATTDAASAGTVGYGKLFDLVLKENSTGNIYYVPAKSGDCKVHTYPTGIVQTGAHIPDGSVAPGHDDHSIVEWVGVASGEGARLGDDYTLIEIRVYE